MLTYPSFALCAGQHASSPQHALEMMASSPPGGFAPGAGSPFLPSFSHPAPSPRQPATPSSHASPSAALRPGGPFFPSTPSSQRQNGGRPPTSQSLQDPSVSFSPNHGRFPVTGSPFSQGLRDHLPLQSPSAASPSLASEGIFGSSLFGASSSAASPPVAAQTSTRSPEFGLSRAPVGATGSPDAAGLFSASSAQQQQHQAAPSWQPHVAAAGPSWLQPAIWQAAGGAGTSWLQNTSPAPAS